VVGNFRPPSLVPPAPVTEVTALFFGDRVGRVADPLGNIWRIQSHDEDVDPAELARWPQDPAAAEALRYVETSLGEAMRGMGA
jgi:PhnB protein